jgi:exopolyphosphatase/guanosine-5'-triphosphate,3'-diphosphate pyrophosphatase
MPRFAALDVGSNAMRLRIVEASAPASGSASSASSASGPRTPPPPSIVPASSSGNVAPGVAVPGPDGAPSGWREVLSLRAPVRLGSEVFTTGRLAPASIGAACAALREFRDAMDGAKVDGYRATATSAVREASNGATLVERARREAGIELEVIEGVEEARLIQLAVVRRLALDDRRVLLIDVGGGSTELTILEGGQNVFAMSLPLGTVRLLETYLRDATSVTRHRAKLIGEAIDRALAEARPHLVRSSLDVLVGTGGNIETLADLAPLKTAIAGHSRTVDVPAARILFAKMSAMTPAERRDAYGLRPDRADTIVPAAAIYLRIAEVLGGSSIVVPGVGLKEGILEELIDKHFHVWDEAGEAASVFVACARLGHRYHFDEAHGQLVARLAGQLFDDLRPLHGLSDRDRLLLRVAALLHDIGDFVRYDAHHKHSYYLIQNSDIMGLTPEERSIVANLARYHRKSIPDPAHPNFRDLDKDARSRVRGLAAILRIADALDREHLAKISGVRAAIDASRRRITLTLSGDDERELEEWTVHAKADLLRDVYGLEVTVAGERVESTSARPAR